MQESSSLEITKKIKTEIFSNLKSLNEKSREYINDIIVLIQKKIGLDSVISIILFGSQISNNIENTIVSDYRELR